MAEKKRQCGTCRFFQDPEERGHGKCGHPLRAGASADLIMYRANELGCRTKWGTSYWQDTNDHSDPTAPSTPQQPTLPEPPAIHAHYDDEVTSVSIAGRPSTRTSADDDVINVDSADYYSSNLQDERRELLSRSSHDALAAARKRSAERMARQRELVPFADEDEQIEEQEPAAEEPQVAASNNDDFPPDDFVEEERSAQHDEDDVLDAGIAPESRRSIRVRNLMNADKRPKDHKAMTFNPNSAMRVESHNPDNRGQWNSVPQISPDIDLPFKIARGTEPPAQPADKLAASAATANVPQPTRPVSQARDVLSEERKRAELRRRVLVTPLPDEAPAKPFARQTPRPTERPQQAEQRSTDTRMHAEDWHHVQEPQQAQHDPAPQDRAPAPQQRHHQPAQPPMRNRVSEARDSLLRGATPQPRFEASATVRPFIEEQERVDLTTARPIERRQPTVMPQQTVATPARQQAPVTEPAEAHAPVVRRTAAQPAPQQTQEWDIADYPLLDMRIEITPDVPRCCGTCRHYRAHGNTDCGNCINRDANPEQGIVEENGMACLSTIGSWWTPADEEVWLDEFHLPDAPTPRMDALLEELGRQRRAHRYDQPVVLPDLEDMA